MNWDELWSMMTGYGLMAAVGAVAVMVPWLTGYWVYMRKIKRSREPLAWGRAAAQALLMGYGLALIAVTLMERGNMFGNLSLQPFSSYIQAWNNMSLREWQMIALNILLFVPLGFLLPLAFPSFHKPARALGAGAAVTLSIELLQLVTGRGIFETDDLLNNFWGCLVGFSLLTAIQRLLTMRREKGMFSDHRRIRSRRQVLAAVAVALTPALVFGCIFFAYEQKEFGNLSLNSAEPVSGEIRWIVEDEKGVENEKDVEDMLPREANIYKPQIYTAEEAEELARKLATKAGFYPECTRSSVYNDNGVFFFSGDNGENLAVWVYFKGGHYHCSFYEVDWSKEGFENKRPLSGSAAAKKLSEGLGVTVPEGASLIAVDQPGRYLWKVDQTKDGSRNGKWGSLSLVLNAEDEIYEVSNELYDLTAVKKVELVSTGTLLDRLKRGQYQVRDLVMETQQNVAYEWQSTSEVMVNSAELTYVQDTKGFLRPAVSLVITAGEATATVLVRAD